MKKNKKMLIIISIIILIPFLLFFIFQAAVCFVPIFDLSKTGWKPCRIDYKTYEKEAEKNDFYSTVDNTTNLNDITINYVPLEKVEIEPIKSTHRTSVVPRSFFWEDYKGYKVFLRYNNNCFYCVVPVVFESGNNGYIFNFYKGIAENIDNGAFIEPDVLAYIDSWPSVKHLNKTMFLPVVNGVTTFDTIKKIDPATYLYDNKDGTSSSFHRFFDGTAMCIEYEQKGNKFLVTFHALVKDTINCADILLPIDLKLIK